MSSYCVLKVRQDVLEKIGANVYLITFSCRQIVKLNSCLEDMGERGYGILH